jgi:L-rhamnose isomerase
MYESGAIEKAYEHARQRYADLGVNTDHALERLRTITVSLQCWQGDDVGGFENNFGLGGSGIQATGNYPGKARNADELRADLDKAFTLIPGTHRLNLHAIYAETGGHKVERDQLGPEHFSAWIDWARQRKLGLDFNGTFFAHPLAAKGFTLSSQDEGIRRFWVAHGVACRKIGAVFGRQLGTPCITNVWIPDGYKDTPADRKTPRTILKRSLDEIFAEDLDPRCERDAVEGKLFGLGTESYVVGSHEFYLGYAIQRGGGGWRVKGERTLHPAPSTLHPPPILLCLDSGHFHPTESVADKLSAVLMYLDEVLLHVSRGVRWDSDHVVILSDELRALAEEIVRGDYLPQVRLGLDFFDASINRVAAWVIGTRSLLKAILSALLDPLVDLRRLETARDYTARLALLEEMKSLPHGAVWDYHCLRQGVPVGLRWLDEIRSYERDSLSRRD